MGAADPELMAIETLGNDSIGNVFIIDIGCDRGLDAPICTFRSSPRPCSTELSVAGVARSCGAIVVVPGIYAACDAAICAEE